MQVSFTLNGAPRSFGAAPGRRLSDLLREVAGLTGTKVGCDAGDCGACTVLVGGESRCACLTPAAQVAGQQVLTIEGLALPGLAAAFARHGAAQCGICTPGMLMAAAELLARNPRPSRAEAQDAIGGVLCRCTGYAKIVAAICDADAPAEVARPAGAVGARLPRLDGGAKFSGAELFGADAVPEGALVLRAVRSPHPHAGFVFGDLAGWVDRPDVARVFTADDLPGRRNFGVIPAFADQPVLAEGRVRFAGEAVALVAFEPGGEADLAGFPVTWEPFAPVPMGAAAPLLHERRASNLLIAGHVEQGDLAEGLAGAAHVVEASFTRPFIEHAYLEPEAGAAWMEGAVLVIRASTQAPMMDRDETAALLNLPPERLRIIASACGGGFGSKLDLSVQPYLGLATLLTGRPSRMVWSRGESMQASTKRHPSRIALRAGCDAAGRMVALQIDGDFDTGAYASWGPTVAGRVPVHGTGPYRIAHYRADARARHSTGPNSGAFRGFGVPQVAIAQEQAFDMLAGAAGVDRLDFRLRNAFRDGDTTATGQVLASVGIVECLQALRPHWQRALAEAEGQAGRGVGIASCWYGCGNTGLPNPSTIRLGLTSAGELRLHQGATDIGQGSNTVITQIAAEALGLEVEDFALVGPDTALTPDCGKTSASRQTFVTGRAAQAAGRVLRAQVLRLVNMGDGARLRLEGGRLLASEGGQEAEVPLASLPAARQGYVLMAEESYDPPTRALDARGQGTPYALYGYGAQIAEVFVDKALGTVKVLRITAAHDLGRAINPLLAEGQIEGGIAQGLGLALMEEYLPGRTENLHDYLIPTAGDMPQIVSLLVEKPDPEGPFGARGLGEHVLIPTAPAILNSIAHATGARLFETPALPHKVRAAIRGLEG